MGAWVYVGLATFVISNYFNDADIFPTTVICLLMVATAYLADSRDRSRRTTVDILARENQALHVQMGDLLKQSIDMEHVGWLTPDGEYIPIVRKGPMRSYKNAPAGSIPLFELPPASSSKWRKP